MASAFLIVFRESLEAALVIGIVLAALAKSGRRSLYPGVWLGAAAGLAASLGVAALFLVLLGEFEGRAEQVFEAAVMLAGAALLTSLLFWLHRGGERAEIEAKAGRGAGAWALGLLAFVSVLREGVETVIFLGSALRAPGGAVFAGAAAGLAAAALVGFLAFSSGSRLSLGTFFAGTTFLLVLFAAGLVARGVAEFVEAGLLPPLVERVWDLNPPAPGGIYPALHSEGAVGLFLKGLFGYSPAPSLAEALAWALYVAGAALAALGAARARAVGEARRHAL